jgi:hypothetical protein
MVDQFAPFVQYEMSTNKTADDKANDVAAITAALEYKPVKEENFRYHLAYVIQRRSQQLEILKLPRLFTPAFAFWLIS